jgi:hypothetical protein
MEKETKPYRKSKIVCKFIRDGLTSVQIERLLDICATSYCKENPIWRHLKVSYAESLDFFRGYLLNSD